MQAVRTKLIALFAAFSCVIPLSAKGQDSSPLIPREDLFGNPEKADAQVSPNGKWLAWLAPVKGVLNVWVAPIGDTAAAVPITADKKRGIGIYQWAFDGVHLAYMQDEGGNENWHLYAVDIEKRTVRDLTPFPDVRAELAGRSRKIREEMLITLNKRDARYPDLFRVNLTTGALALVAENPGFDGFEADEEFTPRLAVKITPNAGAEILRPKGQGWESWLSIPPEDLLTTNILTLDAAGKTLFMSDSRGRNTAALTRVDIATGNASLLAEDRRADLGSIEVGGIDLGGIITDNDTHEPLAYQVNYEHNEYRVLGTKLQADIEFLSKAFGGEWSLGSRSEDDTVWTVAVSSDLGPATNYLYDRQPKTLTKLFDARPNLVGAPLSAMHPVVIEARDGLKLVSYLTLPKGSDQKQAGHPDTPLPMVLLVHGGPWARDSLGYDSHHQWLANRGYAVLSVNFRGSTGFGKAFLNAGDQEWGRKMDGDLLDAVAWAVRERIADPARIAIFGSSYGGYATLVGLTRDADTYACGVDLFGISELERFLAAIPHYWTAFRPQFLKALGSPDTKEGRALLEERSPLYQAGRIKKPLLVAQGLNDARVKKEQSDLIVETLKSKDIPVTYLLYDDEGHGFAKPGSNISFVAIAESFLGKCLGGRAAPVTASDLKGASLEIPVGADAIEGYNRAKQALEAR
jgi:dipeptidyl aminopeptidase/acylaminoacyl peptidase